MPDKSQELVLLRQWYASIKSWQLKSKIAKNHASSENNELNFFYFLPVEESTPRMSFQFQEGLVRWPVVASMQIWWLRIEKCWLLTKSKFGQLIGSVSNKSTRKSSCQNHQLCKNERFQIHGLSNMHDLLTTWNIFIVQQERYAFSQWSNEIFTQ